MKIKFETTYGNICVTDCPYEYINVYEGTTKKVGSYACHDYKDFVSMDMDKREVECNADKTVMRK